MKKLIKILSLTILICFAATNLVSGRDLIKTRISLTPVSPIFYENYIGIETPTFNQEFRLHVEARYNDEIVMDVRILDPGAFEEIGVTEIEWKDDKPNANVFTLKAPDKEGTYRIVFEGTTNAEENFTFSTEIKVVESDSFQTWVRVGGIIGIVIVTALTISLIANAGK